MDIVLTLSGVSRVFGDPGTGCALVGITLAVRRGELVAIVGPPGSGKSVLLDIVAGRDRATSGRLFVCGAAVLLRAADPAAAATAVAGEPALLLADEPGEALDVLRTANARGQTTLIATRDLDLALATAPRVIQLDRGRLVRDAATSLFASEHRRRGR